MMKNNRPTSGIKGKVAGGFTILLLLAFLAVFSVIRLASQLSTTDSGVSSSVTKLAVTSNLLSDIIETDGQARAFISTGDPKYLEEYYRQEEEMRELLDTLISGSIDNTSQYLKMLSVDSLLDQKMLTYENFFELRQQQPRSSTIDLGKFVKRSVDTVKIPNKVISKTVTEELPDKKPKKSFFPRLWDNITGKGNDDTLTAGPIKKVRYDTLTTYKSVHDTTLLIAGAQFRKIQQRERLAREAIAEREMMLVQADQDIMNEIRAILLLFEKEEINKAINSTQNNRHVNEQFWKTALILAAAGLLTVIIFIIMIWKDLARSAFYRNQLEEARSLAESLLKVKEQFLANMSHEIRTPLTSIIGFTERLTETKVNNEQARYLKYINSSSEHLLELINDLLDFTRIDSGKFSLDNRSFNPEELFESAFETLSAKAKEKGLDIYLKQNLPDVNFVGDPLRLRQIVLNLLSNSIKFTGQGKVMLQTKATLSTEGDTANLMIRVADTGIGIPKEKQSLIFEEFSQVDPSITRRYGGSGLGLAITNKLVELMNGSVSLASREGQGTIFTIKLTLPVTQREEIKKVKQSLHENLDFRNVTILLAEDDVTTRMLISEFLESYNANIVSAENGLEAYKLFEKNPKKFGLIITDIQMPVLSGPELLDRIKKRCVSENIKFPVTIGLTAHVDAYESETYKSLGMDYLILKPFRSEDLLNVIDEISGKSIEVNSKTNGLSTESKNIANTSFTQSNKFEFLPDLSSFRKFAGDDEESLRKILTSLCENIKATSDEMAEAYNSRNYSELSLLAHRIQPNVRLLGAQKTSVLLKELELMCRKDKIEQDLVSKKLEDSLNQLKQIRVQLADSYSSY